MPNKYLIILGAALNPSQKQTTSFGQQRTQQYAEGLAKISELAQKFPIFDFVLVDNTIAQDWKMPEEISRAITKIPNLKTVLFADNSLAEKNKGSGVLVALKKLEDGGILQPYEYCLYFEPRQLLLNFDFFERFVRNPANYFKIRSYRLEATTRAWPIRMLLKIIPIFRKQLDMGLFSIESRTFCSYIKNASPKKLAEKNISLEDDMYDKLKYLKFTEVQRLGFIWHNAFTGQDIEF